MRPMRVLVVDDSAFFRSVVTEGLSRLLPGGSEIKTADDPFAARDMILTFDPDVMVLDMELPRMDGVEFLRRLLVQYSQPTIAVSANAIYQEQALAAGALEFLTKPSRSRNIEPFLRQLAQAVERGAGVYVKPEGPALRPVQEVRANLARPRGAGQIKLIALGASTGGTEALSTVITALRPPLPPIVIVQHIPPRFSSMFALHLDRDSRLAVKEAADGDRLLPDHVYVAPGDRHLRVKRFGGIWSLSCLPGPNVNGHCPSVDVLFTSVARTAGAHALGVIMTGMGSDGARGLKLMRDAGARTIGQDESSCVVYGMPRAAYELGAVEHQVPLLSIAGTIMNLVRQDSDE